MGSPAPIKDPTMPAPVLGPGQTYTTVTQKLSAIITSRTPLGWIVAMLIAGAILQLLMLSATWPANQRDRYLGLKYSRWLGLGNYQLCLVDRYWTCGHVNFGYFIAHASAMAQFDQPICRSHDHFRCHVRRYVSAVAHGAVPWVAAYWLLPYPNTMSVWPQFPQSTDMGRICRWHLLYSIPDLLVSGPDSRFCHPARQGKNTKFHRSSTACCQWDGEDRPSTGLIMKWRRFFWRVYQRRWCCPYTPS